MTEKLIQGSEEWRKARCGSVGASQIADVMARTKSGYGASRANLMAQLIAERLTGQPTEGYTNAAMQRGTDLEPVARVCYEWEHDVSVEQVGIIPHPNIFGAHASPDGLVGDDGLVELKCPNSATHLETLLSGTFGGRYVLQAQWQMACTGRAWCDLASYDDRFPDRLRLFVQRIPRDDEKIAELEGEVVTFLKEMNAKLLALSAMMEPKQPGRIT